MTKKSLENIWQFLGLAQDTIGRGRYFVANITASLGLPIVVSLLMSFSFSLFEDEPIILYPLLVLFIASLVFALVVHIKTSIRRVRDIGVTQNWWVLVIIPLVNIPFVIFLCLKKGGSGSGHFSVQNNPFTEQFKRFFSHEFSKPFIIICFGVIVAGAIHTGYVVFDLKQDIDIKITQREEEINRKLTPIARSLFLNTRGTPDWVYDDATHNELRRIKETSSFQLFFEKFGFGWWGVIALVVVFLINVLILATKFAVKYIPILIRTGSAQTKSANINIKNMPAFQRYLLLIAIAILIILVLIFAKL